MKNTLFPSLLCTRKRIIIEDKWQLWKAQYSNAFTKVRSIGGYHGKECKSHKDKEVSELPVLLCQHSDTTLADIVLPPAPEEPLITYLDRTEVR